MRWIAMSLTVGALLLADGLAAVAAAQTTGTYALPGERVFPEGVATREGSREFFVSSSTDGTVFRGRLHQPDVQVFLPPGGDGRTQATGLKVDAAGRLFVSGARTARLFVYERSGRLLRSFDTADGRDAFINDVALTPGGDAYFTDSSRPVLFRVTRDQLVRRRRATKLQPWMSFEGTPVQYGQNPNVNGIVASADGRYLLVVQTRTGLLFRITIATRRVTPVSVPEPLVGGDGMLVVGITLHVVRNTAGFVDRLRLNRNWSAATSLGRILDPSFAFPTTVARLRNRLLVVNSQFDKQRSGTQNLPFTVSSLALPGPPA